MLPDKRGRFGIYGGKYVPETLMPLLAELEEAYKEAKKDKSFKKEFQYYRAKPGRYQHLSSTCEMPDHPLFYLISWSVATHAGVQSNPAAREITQD